MSRTAGPAVGASGESDARDRILETAYDLFSRRGIRDVGVDEIIQRAGVAKATLYPQLVTSGEPQNLQR